MKRIDVIWIAVLSVLLILSIPLSMFISPLLVLILPLGIVITLFMWEFEWLSVIFLFLVLPYMNSIFMTASILPVPGMKYSNVIMLLIIMGFFAARQERVKAGRLAALFYILHLVLFVVSVYRADYMEEYTWEFFHEEYSPIKYFLSHALIPIMTSFPFIMIQYLPREKATIMRLIKYMSVSIMLFSLMILAASFRYADISDLDELRVIVGFIFGMHGNNMVDFLITGFSVMLAIALYKKKIGYWVLIFITLLSVALLNSRAAYMVIILSLVLIIGLTRNFRYYIYMLIPIGLVIIFIPGVVTRMLWGFDTGAANDVSAGRTQDIWGPVIENILDDPNVLIFGNGNLGIMKTQAFKNGNILRVTHAHNAYLDTILNVGLIGLLIYLSFIAYVLFGLFKQYLIYVQLDRKEEYHILVGFMVALGGFLIRCLTDGYLYPNLSNSYFYIVLSLSYLYVRILKAGQDEGVEQLMKAHYIYRIDDVTPRMDWYWFGRLMEVFEEYRVVPLLGVIPDNKDVQFETRLVRDDFFEVIKEYVDKGKAEVAQHGYQHLYHIYEGPKGRVGQPKTRGKKMKTEFKGLPYNIQLDKLKKGREILQDKGIHTDVFMAPSHTFDRHTLRGLKELGFIGVTDGKGLFPYKEEGLVQVPQQMWRPFKVYDVGYYTICLHPQDMTEELFQQIQRHLESGADIIPFSKAMEKTNFGWMNIYNIRYAIRRNISEIFLRPMRRRLKKH